MYEALSYWVWWGGCLVIALREREAEGEGEREGERERERERARARKSPVQIFRAGGEVKKAASARLYHSVSVWRKKKIKKE